MNRVSILAVGTLAVAALCAPHMGRGQSEQKHPESQLQLAAEAMLQGIVRDSSHRPVAGATVYLQAKDSQMLSVRTDSAGIYHFPVVRQGVYSLRAEMAGEGTTATGSFVLEPKESKVIDLILEPAKAAGSSGGRPDFFDEPHFTVAGVTDTTNLGGHGSEVIVGNREAVAEAAASLSKPSPAPILPNSSSTAMEQSLREAASRGPGDFAANNRLGRFLVGEAKAQEALPYLERASQLNPGDFANAYQLALAYADVGNYPRALDNARTLLSAQDRSGQEEAELHHLLGHVEEKLGDPVGALREYQRAAELNPTETNLFDWGAELLIHHAPEPGIEIFTKANRLFPHSVRILAGLGASWYSAGSYDQAVQRFCEASDLNPEDPNPYLFMGKMQAVESVQSQAILERLRRFVAVQPQNALANYYYAVSLWKSRKSPEDVEDLDQVKSLLEKAVHLDPKLGLGYLQLGVVHAEQGDIAKAISDYQQAIAATPELEQAHYRLAQAYRQVGEPSKAHAELQLYEQISKEKEQESERQRHELQQFVYQLRDQEPASHPQ
jgi:tetratricopeptide (TPR) repeat protein